MELGWFKELSLSLRILQYFISQVWESPVPAAVAIWDSKQGDNRAASVAITRLVI